jgi:hypothetical protein
VVEQRAKREQILINWKEKERADDYAGICWHLLGGQAEGEVSFR